MKKKLLCGLIIVFLVAVLAGGCGGADEKSGTAPAPQVPAANKPSSEQAPPATNTVPQVESADYSKYLTVEDVKRITGHKFKLTAVDAKKSGKPDLTFLTTDEGHITLTVQVLRGSDYEKYYSKLRSQDYKPMEYAFWGPKDAYPPRLLGFRKGNTTIIITSYPDAGEWYVNSEMLEKMAKIIAARL